MRKRRRFAVLLAALALAAGLAAVPALATEGAPPSAYTEVPDTGEGDPVTDPLPVPDPGVTEPPLSSDPGGWEEPPISSAPTEEPSDSSSEEPSDSSSPSESTPESSWQEPSDSSSDDPWTGGWEEPEDPWAEPTAEPTQEPWQPEESEPSQGQSTGNAVDPPSYQPGTIATPRPAVERPSVSLNTGSSTSQPEEDSGPNYVTFARLNARGNSMATTLFFSGVGCIAVGVLGLALILILYLRGRRRYAGAEGILEEIHEAEVRQHAPSQPLPPPVQEAPPPAPAPPPPPPGAIMPQQASLYTEEFSLPPQGYEDEDYREEDYGESYSMYREDYPQDTYYDDGDYYGEEYDAPAGQEPAPPAAPQPPVPQDQSTRQFDTEEILREALRYTDDDSQ